MSAFRSLRHRDFTLFLGGQLVSMIGSWMESVAQAWLVYRLTGSAVLLGWVAFATQIPVLLLSPWAGSFADRHDRRRILIAAQSLAMISASALAVLTFSGAVRPWHIIALAAVLGVSNAFDVPARQALTTALVPREELSNAIALNSAMFSASRTVGPALGGLAVAAIGESWCFILNALSFLAAIAGLLVMHRHKAAIRSSSGAHGIWEGFRYIARTRPVRVLVLLIGVSSLFGMPHATLMPVFAKEILGAGADGLGVLMASSGIGSVAGGLLLARKRGLEGLWHWIVFGAGAFALTLIGFAWSGWFSFSALMLLLGGVSFLMQAAPSNTLVQSMTPDALRGRVMALYSMMFLGPFAIGGLVGSWLTHFLSPQAVVAGGGVLVLAAAAVVGIRLPSVREEARVLIEQQASAREQSQPAPR